MRFARTWRISVDTDRAARSMSFKSLALRLPATSMGMALTGCRLAAMAWVRRMSPTQAVPLTASAALRAAATRPERLVSLVCT